MVHTVRIYCLNMVLCVVKSLKDSVFTIVWEDHSIESCHNTKGTITNSLQSLSVYNLRWKAQRLQPLTLSQQPDQIWPKIHFVAIFSPLNIKWWHFELIWMCVGCLCSIRRNEIKGQDHVQKKCGQTSTGVGFSHAGLSMGNVAASRPARHHRLCTPQKTVQNVLFSIALNVNWHLLLVL